MKITLTLVDRITILNLLPEKADLIIMRSIISLRKKVELTSKETKDYEIRYDEGMVFWNSKGEKSAASIDFTTLEVDFIKTGLIEKSKAKQITAPMLEISDKFKFDDSIFK